MKVKCPCCEEEFEVEIPASQPAPAASAGAGIGELIRRAEMTEDKWTEWEKGFMDGNTDKDGKRWYGVRENWKKFGADMRPLSDKKLESLRKMAAK